MTYNAAAGVESRHNLRFRFGGSLTWAAKPRVRGSPDPAIDIESSPTRSPLLVLYPLHGFTHFLRTRFRGCTNFFQCWIGRYSRCYGSSRAPQFISRL